MKNRLKLIIGVAVLALATVIGIPALTTGCQSTPQKTAYAVAGTVDVGVDVAMAGWNQYVKAGKTTVAQELQVKSFYEKYQAAYLMACDAGAAWSAASITNATAGAQAKAAADQAAANATAILADLETTIKSFGATY